MNAADTLKMERDIVDEISALLVKTLHKYDEQDVHRSVSSAVFNSALLKYCISHHINIFISTTPYEVLKPEFIEATENLLENSYKIFLELNAQ